VHIVYKKIQFIIIHVKCDARNSARNAQLSWSQELLAWGQAILASDIFIHYWYHEDIMFNRTKEIVQLTGLLMSMPQLSIVTGPVNSGKTRKKYQICKEWCKLYSYISDEPTKGSF